MNTILYKIKLNGIIFECYMVNYNGAFSAIIKNDSIDEVEEAFSDTKEIVVINDIGQKVATVTDYSGIKTISKLPDYYVDDDGNDRAAIQISLNKMDVNGRIKTLEDKVNNSVNEAAMTLDEYKEYRIEQSKTALEEFLEANPITSMAHGAKEGVYSITKEKQDLMAQQYLTYQITKSVDPDSATLTWNEHGGVCEEWEESEFVRLVMEIKARVYPLVSYQQTIEKQIRDSASRASIAAIEFDYSSVQ